MLAETILDGALAPWKMPRMTTQFLRLLPFLLFVAGCGSPKVWYQPGRSSADAWQDFGDCKMKAARAPFATSPNMSGLGAFMSASIAQGDFFNACMLGKGYRQVRANTVTNGADFPK
jgi:hypothetical protein